MVLLEHYNILIQLVGFGHGFQWARKANVTYGWGPLGQFNVLSLLPHLNI
jgi:hypothetical protein